ncbi:uncharacterized protein A4U43_C07F9650 [Asparagus officinalis]|uniref:Uncharacterized protein n=1 Tax=Asparagus officinalis TaxID=4686 RepID=A0A5P1EAM9_ASPOF|nr:uncharacterized protein A4U43_C07F9650 [Asparagus officinalis]
MSRSRPKSSSRGGRRRGRGRGSRRRACGGGPAAAGSPEAEETMAGVTKSAGSPEALWIRQRMERIRAAKRAETQQRRAQSSDSRLVKMLRTMSSERKEKEAVAMAASRVS